MTTNLTVMGEWSDEEDNDEKFIMKVETKIVRYAEEIPSDLIIDQPDLIEPEFKSLDYSRSFYSGNVKTTHPSKQYVGVKAPLALVQIHNKDPVVFNKPLSLPVPKLPSHTFNAMDKDVVSFIWYECLMHGCDDSELVKVKWIKSIAAKVEKHLGYPLPFDKLTCTKKLERDDYIEFIDIMADLVEALAYSVQLIPTETDKPFICCAFPACVHKTDPSQPCPNRPQSRSARIQQSSEDDKEQDQLEEEEEGEGGSGAVFTRTELFRINIIFHRVMQEKNGVMRVKHVFDICKELGIPYDKHQLPRHVWMNCGEFLVKSQDELRSLIDAVRVKEVVEFDPTAELFKFELPRWLKEEFKGSEILLYEHHFMLIDVDGGGSIDAEELQRLLLGFGTKVPLEEAQAILDEYDIDGGGTIDFVEFMILIYRIQRGTVDLESSELAQALTEAKSQLAIFEEILEVKKFPPEHCGVIHFGNTPVTATFSVQGPPDSVYSGASLVLQLIFYDGYPYHQPDVKVLNRTFHINVISQLDGGGRFLHIKELWSSDWSISKLLTHFMHLLRAPDVSLLPPHLSEIYSAWGDKMSSMLSMTPGYLLEVEQRSRRAAEAKEALSRILDTAESLDVLPPVSKVVEGSTDRLPSVSIVVDENAPNRSRSTSENMAAPRSRTASESNPPPPSSSRSRTASGQKDASPRPKERPPSGLQRLQESKSESDPAAEEASAKRAEERPQPSVWSVLEEEPLIPGKFLPFLTVEMLSNEDIRMKIAKLSRVEQLHLTVLFTHLTDSRKYRGAVQEYIGRFNHVEEERKGEGNEKEGD